MSEIKIPLTEVSKADLGCQCLSDEHGTLACGRCSANLKEQMMEFITKDSGERTQFSSGMVRDTAANKIRYDLVYMPMFKRWAELMTRGAIKYSPNNWMKASGQEELDRFKESAFRHFMTWFLDEDSTEDHAAAVFFNISGAEFVKEKLKKQTGLPF